MHNQPLKCKLLMVLIFVPINNLLLLAWRCQKLILEREVRPVQFFNQTAFTGKDNKRLKSTVPTNHEGLTAAWSDYNSTISRGDVPVPSDEGVDEAKDWVDNGSRL